MINLKIFLNFFILENVLTRDREKKSETLQFWFLAKKKVTLVVIKLVIF